MVNDWDGADGMFDDGPITEEVERPGEVRYAELDQSVPGAFLSVKVNGDRVFTWGDVYGRP